MKAGIMSTKRFNVVFLFLAFSFALRLINLDKGISGDEGALWVYSQRSLSQIFLLLKKTLNYPPLGFLLMHVWMFFAKSETWIRLYFVLFGVGSCYLIYLMASEYVDRQFGRIALFISAISPFLIWTSQYIRSYMDATFWALFSTYFLLRIYKGKRNTKDFVFYVISSLAAIYTAYFNILILTSQAIFMFLFLLFRDRRKTLKFIFAQISVGLLFLPWLPLAFSQYANCSGIKDFWNIKGLRIGGIYLGRYVRQIAVVFGLDPDFLNTGGLLLSRPALFFIAFIAIIIALWFIYISVRSLYKILPKGSGLVYFPIILLVCPLFLANIAEIFYNFRPHGKLFSFSHTIFILLVAAVLYQFKGKRTIFAVLFSSVAIVYLARLPFAYQPEVDTKKVYQYFSENLKNDEIILMVRNTNHYFALKSLPNVTLIDYLRQDPASGNYIAIAETAKPILDNLKNNYRSIWLYITYGNDDLLGGNRLLVDWLRKNGYSQRKVRYFKRIELINYKR